MVPRASKAKPGAVPLPLEKTVQSSGSMAWRRLLSGMGRSVRRNQSRIFSASASCMVRGTPKAAQTVSFVRSS